MTKKKNIKQIDILTLYMEYVLEHGEKPKTVYAFAKQHNFEEGLFYKHYASFDALENAVFTVFFENTMLVLHNSEEYETYDSRNKLLSFYFTFFENLLANRSYVLFALQHQKNALSKMKMLKGLRGHFKKFIATLDIELVETKNERLDKFQQNAIEESAWIQLILTMRFWIDDVSAKFEKTDIFIEKSVNTSFDVLDIKPLKSVIDLGKFIYKEQMNK